jgi:LCCL domain-containing protein
MARLGWAPVLALLPIVWTHEARAQTALGLLPAQNAGVTEAGRRLTFVCPATDGANASVYGTDVYTVDSSVCAAAIHAGVLKPKQAGAVSMLIGSSVKEFKGSTRNGVTTKSYGAWPYSFTFVTDGAPGTITWQTTWSQIPPEFTQSVSVVCPPGGRLNGAVWGTDVYTRDSTICVAAVHAGKITVEKGGEVAVQRIVNSVPFTASERYGVKTAAWSAQQDAFSVTAAQPAAALAATPAPAQRAARTSSGAVVPPAAATSSTAVVAPTDAAAGVTLSPVAPPSNTGGNRVREAPAAGNLVRNTNSVTATVKGLSVVVSWSPVLGASWYGVAGASQDLWREVRAPATSVKYFLPFGDYDFSVGAYFEPGPASTPANTWPKAHATVARPQTPQQRLEMQQSLVELEQWKIEQQNTGQADDSDIMKNLEKAAEEYKKMQSTTSDLFGR